MHKSSGFALVFAALVMVSAGAQAHGIGHGHHRHHPQVTIHKLPHHVRPHPRHHWRHPPPPRHRVHRHFAPRHQPPLVIIVKPWGTYHLHDPRHPYRW